MILMQDNNGKRRRRRSAMIAASAAEPPPPGGRAVRGSCWREIRHCEGTALARLSPARPPHYDTPTTRSPSSIMAASRGGLAASHGGPLAAVPHAARPHGPVPTREALAPPAADRRRSLPGCRSSVARSTAVPTERDYPHPARSTDGDPCAVFLVRLAPLTPIGFVLAPTRPP